MNKFDRKIKIWEIKEQSYLERNRWVVTQSKLKLFLKNPEEYKLKYIDWVVVEEEEKRCFTIWTALHDWMWYWMEYFQKKYFVQEKRMLKADYQKELAKLWLETDWTVDELETRLLNWRIKLTAWESKTLISMFKEIARQPLADLWWDYKKEVQLEVDYKWLTLRWTLDRIDVKNKVIRDWKTTANIEKLIKDITWWDTSYLFQVSFYYLMAKIKYDIECDVILDIIDKTKNTCYYWLKFTKEQIKSQLPVIISAIEWLLEEWNKLKEWKKAFQWPTSDLRLETFSSEYYPIMDSSIQKNFEYIETKQK